MSHNPNYGETNGKKKMQCNLRRMIRGLKVEGLDR